VGAIVGATVGAIVGATVGAIVAFVIFGGTDAAVVAAGVFVFTGLV
jgi:hypothetical protein